ncbi:MAG: tetratricopeptide repeat protein, partial [Elusimicrobia bacterium]|nr:tetratricopeptide repeat protein [Elusimicrobiota bacterium]
LYIMPAGGGGARKMQCNRALMNSWHSWSPNGKWLVFSSKANGPYTQLFLTHIDEQGNDTPPVILERLTSPDRAANIPEFVNTKSGALKIIHEQFIDDMSFARAARQFILSEDYASAAQAALKAQSINPDNSYAHYVLGVALEKQNKFEEAIMQFTEALRLTPNTYEPHNELGLTLAMQAALTEEVFRANEKSRPGTDAIGIKTQNTQAMYEQAVLHLKEALRLNPNFTEAYNNLGFTLNAQGEFEKAIPPLTEALRLNPDYVDAHDNMGWALKGMGRLDEAISHFNKALMLDPTYTGARNGLNQTLWQKRNQKPRQQ